jgi:proteasome lid subunit RPN8/RPN11
VTIEPAMREAILEHCRRGLPNEACGLIAGDAPLSYGGRPTRWLPARNALASPYRYELEPEDLLRLTLDVDDAGEVVWAIVHSHVASSAVPSPADVRAWRYPQTLQIVVSLAGEPSLRAWLAAGGGLTEVPLEARPD